jgi:hypothetical protein
MKHAAIVLFLSALTIGGSAIAAKPKSGITDLDAYVRQYPYMTYRGTALTFDSEFEWPEGYSRLDSSAMTPFQYWVSYVPLWNPARPVGATKVGILYKPEQVSRPINLPWRTTRFFDDIIPLQLLLEYQLAVGDTNKYSVKPRRGDLMTYGSWLSGEAIYTRGDSLHFQPGEKRESTDKELIRFFGLVSLNTNYASLEANCSPVADTALRPGDLYLARSEDGLTGKVYIVMCVIQNKAGDRKYIVATGCSDACDFYIPLFNDRKDYPWLSLDEVKALISDTDFPSKGFYRLPQS